MSRTSCAGGGPGTASTASLAHSSVRRRRLDKKCAKHAPASGMSASAERARAPTSGSRALPSTPPRAIPRYTDVALSGTSTQLPYRLRSTRRACCGAMKSGLNKPHTANTAKPRAGSAGSRAAAAKARAIPASPNHVESFGRRSLWRAFFYQGLHTYLWPGLASHQPDQAETGAQPDLAEITSVCNRTSVASRLGSFPAVETMRLISTRPDSEIACRGLGRRRGLATRHAESPASDIVSSTTTLE